MMWAASTFVHSILACAFLAACEGMCSDASCDSHRTLFSTPLGLLKWPTTGLNGFALAWWPLQQCCMLHIFFSRRFAAIVDRLWMGPISLFYCRLYFYFIVTSALLAASYIPSITYYSDQCYGAINLTLDTDIIAASRRYNRSSELVSICCRVNHRGLHLLEVAL
mmetsp:Transcript_33279/g.61321  ORF Transcript_33279/g.61321 Transcript_33279/m.61321 type:complete len:165 (+) Transcript_33279:589-1083(+)